MGKLKEKLIKEFQEKPFTIDEVVLVSKNYIPNGIHIRSSYFKVECLIIEVMDDTLRLKVKESIYKDESFLIKKNLVERDTLYVGVNPFPKDDWMRQIIMFNYDIGGIMTHLHLPFIGYENERCYNVNGVMVKNCNFNPYVFDKDGNKQFYQRDFTWTLNDEKLFIESIYQNIDCGKIVIRKRSWKWVKEQVNNGNTDVFFNDIVDGKQRINTLYRFMNDKFKDLHGNYYSDLSERAQRMFESSTCISTLIMNENTKDEDVIRTFLMVNFSGKPMSKKHLDFVKEINKKM